MINWLVKVQLLVILLLVQYGVMTFATEQNPSSFIWLTSNTPIVDFLSTDYFVAKEMGRKNTSFNGHLSFVSINNTGKLKIYKDVYGVAEKPALKVNQLPSIAFDIVQYQQWIIPTLQAVQRSSHANWEWQVSPGKIWQQESDHGYWRVALPFSLQEKNANCTHNGLLLLFINEAGQTKNGIFQIASETCTYFQFDLVGRIKVEFEKKVIERQQATIEQFKQELNNKLPRLTSQDLIRDYPELNIQQLMPRDKQASTTSGVVINNKHYNLNCDTRYGPYPYCDWLALPSYSTAKSIFAGLGLMRLQALVPQIENALVSKLVTQCNQEKWQKVTLGDLINMRTGNYISKNPHSDEASKVMLQFFLAKTNQQKLALACGSFPKKSIPGKRFNYHTSDTYIAGVMLNKLYQKMTGQKDFYQGIMVNDLWRHMKLSSLLDQTKRTYDQSQQHFTGWGLTFYIDDIIKITNFLQQQTTSSLLDQKLINSAMQYGDEQINREAGEANLAYNYGFWALQVANELGCKKPKWIPFMSGFGGITIAMVSPDILYYNFADNQRYLWLDKITALNRLFPICESK